MEPTGLRCLAYPAEARADLALSRPAAPPYPEGTRDPSVGKSDSACRQKNLHGDANLITNIAEGQVNGDAEWGTAYSSGTRSNHAEFTGSLFDGVGVGEQFLIGMLEYHNGTTDSGTNATAIDFTISIAFMEGTVTESFDYNFGLYSTPNNTGTEWGDADYFGLNNIQSSGTVNIFGDDYRLELAFGHTSNNDFAIIDEFHIYENSTGYGELWGMIVRF